jgi:hypothetical protein
MKLQPKDVEQVISKSVLFDTLAVPDWTVDYSGSKDSQIALILLNNRGIDQTTLDLIVKKLNEANCIGISKTNDGIKIRFKGHRFDNFNYVFLANASERTDLNKLTDNFFWEHFESGIYCEWTNWGWI